MRMIPAWFEAHRDKIGRYGLYAVLGLVAVAFIWGFIPKARAADPQKSSPIALPSVNTSTWTGCGVGIGASLLDGELSGFGGPTNIGADGQMLDARFLCDVQMGSFVVGLNADYGRVFGDLETLGADTAWALGGRVGPLINPNTLLFVSGGWTRAETSVIGNLDGWYLGGGLETKLPSSPLYLVLEYQRRTFDLTDIGAPAGLDGTVDVIRAGVNIKLHFWK